MLELDTDLLNQIISLQGVERECYAEVINKCKMLYVEILRSSLLQNATNLFKPYIDDGKLTSYTR